MNDPRPLMELVSLAESYRLVALPAGFSGWSREKQQAWAAKWAAERKQAADAGDRDAQALTRFACWARLFPAEPTPVASLSRQTADGKPKPRLKRKSGPIRVGFITPLIAVGGTSQWIKCLCRHLPRQSDGKVSVVGVAVAPNASTARCRRVESEIAAFAPILHGETAVANLAALCDVLVVWGVGSLEGLPAGFAGPVIYVGHGHCDWTVRMVRGCLPRLTHWVSVSQSAAQSFPDARQVTVIHNGIDPDRCRQTRKSQALRAEWGLTKQEIALGYVGRLSSEKAAPDVARAAASLGAPFRPVLIGDGWQADKILAEARQICPSAIHVPPVSSVGDVMHALDCLFLTSPSEGFSLALAEAWYCGLPTVATRVGAIPELEPIHGQLAVDVPIHASDAELAAAARQAISPANFPVVDRAACVVRGSFLSRHMAQRWSDYLCQL